MSESMVSLLGRGRWLLVVAVVAVAKSAGAMIDMDGDGMSDIWEKLHETSPGEFADPDADPDLDGVSNLDESIAGTDPHDGDDFLALDVTLTPAGLEFAWDEQPGKQYTLESSATLGAGSWVPVAAGAPAPVSGGRLFYRVTVTDSGNDPSAANLWEESMLRQLAPAEDWDGDGLDNAAEADAGTNPLDRDSDRDGLLDHYELLAGTDPNGAGEPPHARKPSTGLVIFSPRPAAPPAG